MRACGRVIGGGCALACVHACVCTRVRVCVCACMHACMGMCACAHARMRAYADARCVMPNRHPTFPHLPHLTRPRPRLRPTPTCTSPLTLMTPVRTLTLKKQARPRRGLSVSQVQVLNQQHIFTRPPTPSEPVRPSAYAGVWLRARARVCALSCVCVCVCVYTRKRAPEPEPEPERGGASSHRAGRCACTHPRRLTSACPTCTCSWSVRAWVRVCEWGCGYMCGRACARARSCTYVSFAASFDRESKPPRRHENTQHPAPLAPCVR